MHNSVLNGIIGLCVADALGVPVEFVSRDALKENPVQNMQGYGTHNQPHGTWSDDTSMTLCLLDSLAAGFNTHDIMRKFKAWYTQGEFTPYGIVFDVGIATREAILRFVSGSEPLECGGKGERDNGNGSLMRILPLCFYIQALYGEDFQAKDEVFDMIHQVSALTHAHHRSQIACGIYLCIASKLDGTTELKSAIASGIQKAVTYYRQKPEFAGELVHYTRLLDKNFCALQEVDIRSSGYVVDTLEAAIWCLLNTNSYKDCVLMAVNLGEDTDTVAAVAGGLAGLHYGITNIPNEWVEQIVKRDYIEALSNQLYQSLKT